VQTSPKISAYPFNDKDASHLCQTSPLLDIRRLVQGAVFWFSDHYSVQQFFVRMQHVWRTRGKRPGKKIPTR